MDVACVQASVRARRPPYTAHGNFNVSPRLPAKYHDAGLPAHKDREVIWSYPDNHCWLSFVFIQAWRRDFYLGVNALSVTQGVTKIDVPGRPGSS